MDEAVFLQQALRVLVVGQSQGVLPLRVLLFRALVGWRGPAPRRCGRFLELRLDQKRTIVYLDFITPAYREIYSPANDWLAGRETIQSRIARY
jgi:hypothetical protein